MRRAIQMVRTARGIAGALIDRGLDRIAKHICATRPGDVAAAQSTDRGNGLRGYVIPDKTSGAPYMTRILFPRVFGVRPMLHHIHRPDYDRDLHDHPWAWSVSILLRGSYDEERPAPCHHSDCTRTVKRHVRWLNVIRASDWHRISELHGNVWTLFVTGPRVQKWGFRRWDSAYEEYVKIEASAYRTDETPIGRGFVRPTIADIATAAGADLERLAYDWFGIERDEDEHGGVESDSDLRERIVDELHNPTR